MKRRTYSNLRDFIKKTDTRQIALAAKWGVSQAYISRLVNNLADPNLSFAIKVAEEAHIPIESLAPRTDLS